ncbi:MAG: UDP-4-amino-4,6-dideoxy-N-acetyl-beta-L-altrosamine transaminase [Dissulfurimicrobium sp.]|uniref:UDP-4-amino-4, 6-dideoxy-N-acetyl-beta-L-altrosamine transaminase n=1 Tax=Dissulfurimicrobium TaxID=1769732 RepID=UPI001EDC3280|nr:UDP-4-amino-4,6-dideoxy-N-acetyl-beta-L-altrosamine transaminase [Dissulfurimicrobium hydrothermale]UKL12907.1 UDP-4-amino-4,6-dideoxy-N-acetyl-beta-L-altrosamine transaminase [Dissulfurimicrobium hydrothermale]
MSRKFLPYGRHFITEEDIEAVSRVLRSDWLTQGPEVSAFEEALCRLTGARYAVAVSNGTAALYLACRALDIKEGDLGITTPLSFVASANCMAICGARVDFVDIEMGAYCMDPEALERFCLKSGPPKVVVAVDFAGIPAALPTIWDLAGRFGFHVIEDAAHAIGSRYLCDERWINCGECIHSDLAIFSFHPVKTITCGEGGVVLTNDDGLAERVKMLATHGIERRHENFVTDIPRMPWAYEMQELSLNFRLSDIHAALGLSQIKRLPGIKQKRQEIFAFYNSALRDLESKGLVKLPTWQERHDPCPHLYVLLLTKTSPIDRDDLYLRLKDISIGCQVHYWPIHLQPYYAMEYDYGPSKAPNALEFARNALSLPLFPSMDQGDMERVVQTIHEIME